VTGGKWVQDGLGQKPPPPGSSKGVSDDFQVVLIKKGVFDWLAVMLFEIVGKICHIKVSKFSGKVVVEIPPPAFGELE